MRFVKNFIIFSILVAATYGVVTKINIKRKLAKEAAKKNLLSIVMKFLGTTFNMLGHKMKRESNWRWKKAFMHG